MDRDELVDRADYLRRVLEAEENKFVGCICNAGRAMRGLKYVRCQHCNGGGSVPLWKYREITAPRGVGQEPRVGWMPVLCSCGHPEGSHRSVAAWPFPLVGVCFAAGCECVEFEDPS